MLWSQWKSRVFSLVNYFPQLTAKICMYRFYIIQYCFTRIVIKENDEIIIEILTKLPKH